MSERKDSNAPGLYVGGMTAALGALTKSSDKRFKQRYADSVDRANFVNDNWHSSLETGELGFHLADPKLSEVYIKDGKFGLHTHAGDIFQKNVGKVGTPWTPADITNAGKFAEGKAASGNQSILTVTPDANSARFGAPNPNPIIVGGGQSETLGGNGGKPQYSYAHGNYAVGRKKLSNPSAHFSEVDLPEGERRKYLTTSQANNVGQDGRGWGVSHWDQSVPITSGHDVHFGKEHRVAGGVTTANDMYTYIRQQGFEPPDPTGKDPGAYLKELTETVQRLNGGKSAYETLESLASPTPLWGEQTRNLGNLPATDQLKWLDGGLLREGAQRAGAGTFFDIQDISVTDPFDPNWVPTDGMKVDADAVISPRVADGPKGGPGKSLVRRGLGGAVGALATSPEAADQLRAGNYGNAAAITGMSYGAGEAISAGANQVVDQLVKRGHYWAPKALQTIGNAAQPLVGLDVIDTATTLATGKNSREILVDSGNTGPAVATSMAPITGAPLGMAGSTVQATVPKNEERYAKAKELEANREAAIKRGGRWRLAGFNIPEFGLSEVFGIN